MHSRKLTSRNKKFKFSIREDNILYI